MPGLRLSNSARAVLERWRFAASADNVSQSRRRTPSLEERAPSPLVSGIVLILMRMCSGLYAVVFVSPVDAVSGRVMLLGFRFVNSRQRRPSNITDPGRTWSSDVAGPSLTSDQLGLLAWLARGKSVDRADMTPA